MSKDFYKELENVNLEIDREQENKDVALYQQTKDENIIRKVFEARIPTLKYWATKHYFPGLAQSIEDFYGELVIVFVKTVKGYKYGRGSFNTCLYTFLSNRIKNIKSGKYAKKRKPDTYEGSISSMTLSLDHAYSYDNVSGKPLTLEDKIINEHTVNPDDNSDIHLYETIKMLSGGNEKLEDMFVQLSSGKSVSTVLKESKIKEGIIDVLEPECLANKDAIYDKIKSHIVELNKVNSCSKNLEFELIEYNVKDNKIKYIIEMKKTEESELLSKTIRKLKKNKGKYSFLGKGIRV